MNSAAVKAWEEKVLSSKKLKRQRRRRRRLATGRDRTISDTTVELPRLPPRHTSENTSRKSYSGISPKNSKYIRRNSAQASSFSRPNIIVRVSQHSNFDRDLYIAYQSSLSTQGTSSSSLPNSKIGLGESSPSHTTNSLVDGSGVIPDSQSLPGSSSYKPTSSASLAVPGADQTPPTNQAYVSQSSTNIESSTEDSSAVPVTSQPSLVASRRSRSEPTPDSNESSLVSPFGTRLLPLSRSISDPSPIHYDQHRRRAVVPENPRDCHIVRGEIIQDSSNYQSRRQTRADYTQQRRRASKVQIPASADQSSHQSHVADDPPASSLNFQTKVPLAFASQGSRVAIASAGTCSSGFSNCT